MCESCSRFFYFLIFLLVSAVLSGPVLAQWTPMNPVKSVQQQADGVLFTLETGTLKLQVCSDSMIHVLYSPTALFPKQKDFVVIKESWPATKFTVESTDEGVTVSTSL